MWHRLSFGHWFSPHVVGYDKYGFSIIDGCERCLQQDYDV